MPSINFVVRKDVIRTDGKSNIKCRVSHRRSGDKKGKVRYIATPYYIKPGYLGTDGRIKSKYVGQANLNSALLALETEYNNIIADTGTDIFSMDINTLVSKMKAQKKHGSDFLAYMKHRILELKKEDRHRYAESYEVTIGHLEAFTKKKEISFNEITAGFLNDFKGHLRQVRRSKVNTIRIYLNNIRAVFYSAIDGGIIKADLSPFRGYKIEQEKTKPRPLTIEQLRILMNLRPSATKRQKRAIDIFFLIFYLCGINCKDLLYLRKDDIIAGRVVYKRFKTGRDYSIKIVPEAQDILNRYPGEKYLLCLMDEKEKVSPGRMAEADSDILHQVNKLLKTVTENAECLFKPTTYCARYSWATIASKSGVQRDTIAHALGHGVDTMTDIYIDFDQAKVDRANKLVISKLKNQ
jgi:integrase